MLKRMIVVVVLMLGWVVPGKLLAQHETAAHPQAEIAAHPAETEHAGGGEHQGSLLPPLAGPGLHDTLLSALWVIIIFVVMLMILYPTAWRNVLEGLKKREQRIRKDIADAEAARAKAEATLKEFNAKLATAEARSQEMISKAVSEGERLATSIKMSAQQEAEEAKERATRDIEASKNQAIAEIREQAVYLATTVAEKIIRKNLNAEDQRALVKQSLEQLQGIGRG
jgi:F-type H+-transporting ATPase subunit b